ncbi:MAG: hypothetical protein QXH80_00530, partial [Candidatus Nanoarchaeia archaeon]
ILTVGTGSLAVATTARSFVPRSVPVTLPPPAPVCGVTLTALILSPQAGPRAVCFPYNLTNTGGTTEIYNVSIANITGPCGALLFSGSLSCSGAPLTSFLTGSMAPSNITTFSLEHGPPAGGVCTVTIQAVSTTNSSCSDTDITTTNS